MSCLYAGSYCLFSWQGFRVNCVSRLVFFLSNWNREERWFDINWGLFSLTVCLLNSTISLNFVLSYRLPLSYQTLGYWLDSDSPYLLSLLTFAVHLVFPLLPTYFHGLQYLQCNLSTNLTTVTFMSLSVVDMTTLDLIIVDQATVLLLSLSDQH